MAQFALFVQATGHRTTAEARGNSWGVNATGWFEMAGATWQRPKGKDDEIVAKANHPVTHVSWHDAVAFCRWAGVRLPTIGWAISAI